jgi:hypothetical protein
VVVEWRLTASPDAIDEQAAVRDDPSELGATRRCRRVEDVAEGRSLERLLGGASCRSGRGPVADRPSCHRLPSVVGTDIFSRIEH